MFRIDDGTNKKRKLQNIKGNIALETHCKLKPAIWMFDDGGEVEEGGWKGRKGEGGSAEQPASSHQAPSPPPSTS